MTTVNALMAQNIGNAMTNIKTWEPVSFNVLEYGLKGDGVTDDTTALQVLINKAIAAGRRTILFPKGFYYVTGLTNADQVDFVGDNSQFVGGYAGTITNLGEVAALKVETAQRFVEVDRVIKIDRMNARKAAEIDKNRSEKIDDFTQGLRGWTYTPGIGIASNQLKMISDSGLTHLNAAIFNEVDDVRAIEATIASGGVPQLARLVFAHDSQNWVFTSPLIGGTSMSIQRVVAGKLDSSSSLSFVQSLTAGSRIKIVIHGGSNIQYFVDDILLATFYVAGAFPYVLPTNSKKIKAGVAFRNLADTWIVDNVKVFPARPHKLMHFSFDDGIVIFKNLADNQNTYTSIFDEPKMAFLKSMHDKYGIVVSMYLFYEQKSSGWNLSSMPTKYATEFRQNSDWLKLGFHAYNQDSNYGNGTQSAADALNHYNLVVNAIRSFASGYNLDSVIRLGNFAGTLAACQALRDAEFKTQGFLTSDDSRSSDYYLSALQRTSIEKCDDFYDATNSLYFVRTDLRIESYPDPAAQLESRKTNLAYAGQMDLLAIFTHENRLSTLQGEIEDVFKWAVKNEYIFEFPMNYIPES